jgi:putative restriction endonuclease
VAVLRKRDLFDIVERSILDSGWKYLRLSAGDDHPARYQIYRDDENNNETVRIYIWNLTHGGGAARAADEYRIQITGIASENGSQQFFAEPDGKTVILGWWQEIGVFAGFDYSFHSGPLGNSPSIQIREAALRNAHANGFAAHNKGNGELAIAFRPDFMGTYLHNLEELHDSGTHPEEISLLEEIAENPDNVDEAEIEKEIPPERQYAVVSTRKALRDINFRNRVLTAYGQRCAMCGVQLKLLDAAHILPVAHPDSTDQTSNGVALCALHHRAFDRALVTFDDEHKIHVHEAQVKEFAETGHDGGIEEFRKALRPALILPPDKRDRPDSKFVLAINALRGWVLTK